ncbi:hypothetical protein Tco_1489849 [Tanacetum coccineum]
MRMGTGMGMRLRNGDGDVAYRLKLPQELSCVHDMFHVSNLKKCLAEPDVQVPLDEIEYTWEREDQFRKKYPNLFSESVLSSSVAT